MVSHRRRRTVLTALGLYTFAALFVGYFAVNAFTGNHGLRAQADLDQQLATMQSELVAPESRARAVGAAGGAAALRPASIPTCWTSAPARCSGLADPRDLVLLTHPR